MTERFTAAPFSLLAGGGSASCNPPIADTTATETRPANASEPVLTRHGAVHDVNPEKAGDVVGTGPRPGPGMAWGRMGALAVLASERACSALVRGLILTLAVLIPVAVAVAVGRVYRGMYRGMHYLPDVVGGILLGGAWRLAT